MKDAHLDTSECKLRNRKLKFSEVGSTRQCKPCGCMLLCKQQVHVLLLDHNVIAARWLTVLGYADRAHDTTGFVITRAAPYTPSIITLCT